MRGHRQATVSERLTRRSGIIRVDTAIVRKTRRVACMGTREDCDLCNDIRAQGFLINMTVQTMLSNEGSFCTYCENDRGNCDCAPLEERNLEEIIASFGGFDQLMADISDIEVQIRQGSGNPAFAVEEFEAPEILSWDSDLSEDESQIPSPVRRLSYSSDEIGMFEIDDDGHSDHERRTNNWSPAESCRTVQNDEYASDCSFPVGRDDQSDTSSVPEWMNARQSENERFYFGEDEPSISFFNRAHNDYWDDEGGYYKMVYDRCIWEIRQKGIIKEQMASDRRDRIQLICNYTDHLLIRTLIRREHQQFARSVQNRIALCERHGLSAATYHEMLRLAAPLFDVLRPQGAMMSGQYTHTHNLSTEVDEVLEGVMTQLNDIADKMHLSTSSVVNGAGNVASSLKSAATNVQMYLGLALILIMVTLTCICASGCNVDYTVVVPIAVVGGILGTMLAARVDLGSIANDIVAWFSKPRGPTAIVLQASALEETSEIGRMLCEVASICFFSTRVKYDSGIDSLLRTLNTAENDSRTLGSIFTRVSDVVLRIVEKVCHAVGCEVSLTVQSGFMHAFKEIEAEINQLMTEVESSEYVTHVHEAKLQGLIDNITSLLVKMPAKSENNVVRSKLNTTLGIVKSTLMQVKLRLQALAGARFETFCFNLVGTPGCGKTTLLYKMLYRFLALVATPEELKRLDEITKQPVNVIGNSTKYFEGFDPRLWITVINEIFQGKEPKDATAFSRLLIDMLGGNKCPLPMAGIDKKGVTNFEARMMLCAGNNLSLPLLNGLEAVGQHALMRRMDACCWRMIVTREFAKLDASGNPIVQGTAAPGMTENTYGYMLDTDMAHMLPHVDGEPNMSPFRMVEWNYATGAPRNRREYTIDEFFEKLKHQYELHCTKQRKLLTTTEVSRAAFIARMAPPEPEPVVLQALTVLDDETYDSSDECYPEAELVAEITSQLLSAATPCPLSPYYHYLCSTQSSEGFGDFVSRVASDCTCSDKLKHLWNCAATTLTFADYSAITTKAVDTAEDIEIRLQAGSVVVQQEHLDEILAYSEVDYANYTNTMAELHMAQERSRARDRAVGVSELRAATRADYVLMRDDMTLHERFCETMRQYVTEPVSALYSKSAAACRDAYSSSLAVMSAYLSEVVDAYEDAKNKWWLWMLDHPILSWCGVTAAGVFMGGIVYNAVCGIVERLSGAQTATVVASPLATEVSFAYADPLVEQAKVTTGMDNVRTAVARNSYLLKLTAMTSSGRGASRSGHALFAKGRSFITNTHTWDCSRVEGFKTSSEDILVELFVIGSSVPFFSFYKKYALVRGDYECNDITIVTCPVGVREHKDITCYMLKPDDHEAVKAIKSENLVGCMLGASGAYRSGLFHYTGTQLLPSDARAVVRHTLGVSMVTADGECGLPVLVSSPTLTRLGKTELVLTGIHFAKREHSEFGLSNILTSNIFDGLPLSSSEGGLSDVLTLQAYSEKLSELSVAVPSSAVIIPVDDVIDELPQRIVGEIKPAFSNVTMSDYIKAPLYKFGNEELKELGCDVIALKRPVNLRDQPGETSLTIASIAGYGQNKHQLHDPLLLQEITAVIASNVSESLYHQEDRSVPILDYCDIINTGELQDLDLSKASGPLVQTIRGIKRKVLFPERDLTSPVSLEFFAHMKDYENSICDGCPLIHVSTQSLKSELRPITKKIPRTFFMQDLTYLLLAKKFLGQFVNDAPKLGLFVAVGMNTYKEAESLYHEFNTAHTIVGDHEKFDKYQLAQVTMCLDVIVEAYYRGTPHDNPRSRGMRYKLLYTLVHWYAIVTTKGRSYIVEVDGAMPSGDLRTAVFNSLYNYVASVYVICRQYQFQLRDARSLNRDTIKRIVRGMRARFYGDDFLLSLEHVPELYWFTFFHLKEGFAREFGTVLTTSRKDGVEAPFQKLEEEMWLGRHFKIVDGEPVLALKLASIFGCLYYQHKGISPDEYRQMIENSLMELSLHGRTIFSLFADKMQAAYHAACGGILVNTMYETARLNCKSRVNEY